MEKYLKKIKNSAAVSLWTSIGLVIMTALFFYVSNYRFYASNYTVQWLTIAGSVLAVLAISMSLLTIRRQVPQLRQNENLEHKLQGYSSLISNVCYGLLFVIIALCAIIVLTNRNALLMVTIVVVMMLFLTYPNIYRIKHDLGLTDEQMTSLFGDKYIPSNEE